MRFLWLDGLRGVASCFVLGFHFFQGSNKFASFGWLAVDVFFVLSGFVLCVSVTQAGENGLSGLKTFWKKRVIRLYPMLVLALILTLLPKLIEYLLELFRGTIGNTTAFESNDPIRYFFSILLLQFLFPTSILLLVPLWSLSTELYSNLLQVFFRLTGSLGRICLGMVIGFLLIVFSGISYDLNLDWSSYNTWLFGFGRALVGFNVGQVFWIFRSRHDHFSRKYSFLFSLMGLIFSVNIWLFAKDLILLPVYFSFGFLVLALSKCTNPCKTSVVFPFLKVLGETSYPIYLFHTIILGFLPRYYTIPSFVNFIVLYSINLVFTFFVLKYVEPRVRFFVSRLVRVLQVSIFRKRRLRNRSKHRPKV